MTIAILGCGSIGARHAANLLTLGRCDLVAYDPDEASRRRFVEQTGVQTVDDIDRVWAASPDIALITSPTNLHIPLATEAAQRGCHLLIEKPLSHSWQGVDELSQIVEKNGLISLVACNMRFHPGPAKLRELLLTKAVGGILAARIQASSYLPSWRPWQDFRQSYSASSEWGGILLDGIHELDLALWLLGPASLLFAAQRPAASLGLKTDGLAELVLEHRSGTLSNIHLNFVQRDYRRTIQIIGESGTIYWDFREEKVRVFNSDGAVSEEFAPPSGWTLNDMYLDELRHFLDCVSDRRATSNPLSGGVAALEIALDARTHRASENRWAA